MMQKIKYRLIAFLSGRYGMDKLGKAILWTAIAFAAINIFAMSPTLYAVQTALLVWEMFRFLSRNTSKRYAENAAFEKLLGKLKTFFSIRRDMLRDRKTHVYRKCLSCKAMLRLPKSKGHHTVRCPRCSNRFEIDI